MSQKTHTWIVGTCILWILSIFIDFRVPQTHPWSMIPPLVLFFRQTNPFLKLPACGISDLSLSYLADTLYGNASPNSKCQILTNDCSWFPVPGQYSDTVPPHTGPHMSANQQVHLTWQRFQLLQKRLVLPAQDQGFPCTEGTFPQTGNMLPKL